MGSYTFKWEHPEASEVFVTGTFDDWGKTQKLDKLPTGFFEKSVQLPEKVKVLYKFVVDGNWVTNSHLPTETDASGNVNNVLQESDIIHPSEIAIASVGAAATTAALAGAVPKESEKSVAAPGAFPETPAAEPSSFSVNPIPATEGAGNPIKLAPGESVPDPSTLTSNTISSTVKDDPELVAAAKAAEEPSFSVNPIPATAGVGNPIKLTPGEAVPDASTVTGNTIASTVKDDPELVAADKAAAEPTFSVNPIPATAGAGNPIKLAPGEAVPDASTLTGNTVQSTVKTDEASYNASDAVAPVAAAAGATEKKEAEVNPQESGLFGVPPAVGTIIPESGLPIGSGGPAIPDEGPGAGILTSTVGAGATTAALAGAVPLEPRGVPEVVTESQQEAHVSPEASANPVAVEEKKELEEELKSKVPEEPAAAESAPAAAAAAVASPAEEGVPEVVKESISEAHASPEAAANPEAVKEKEAVEAELESKVKPVETAGEPAPTVTAATSDKAPEPTPEAAAEPTNGTPAATDSTPAKSEAGPATPSKSTDTPETKTAEKKKKRRSVFLQKLKKIFD